METALIRRRRGGSALAFYAANGLRPKFVLDPSRQKYFTDGSPTNIAGAVTHSRAGNATVLDADGVLKWTPHNLLTYSEDFSNAAWGKALGSITGSNTQVAPDGTLTADEFTSSSAFGNLQQTLTLPNVPHTFSVWIKAGTSTSNWSLYNGSNGDVIATITPSSEWQLLTGEFTPTAATTVCRIQDRDNDNIGSVYLWGGHLYRSDLGGMQSVPMAERGLASSETYLPTTSAARYLPRSNAYAYVDGVLTGPYLQHESAAATNLLHNTDALVTQTETVTAQPYTLHFTGTGTVTLSGASTAGPLVGTGTGENNRVSLTFTPSAGTLTLTVSGTVTNAQLEAGSIRTSYIPNLAGSGSVTRAAETLTIDTPPWPAGSAGSRGLAIAMDGLMTYADTDSTNEVTFLSWLDSASNFVDLRLATNTTRTGGGYFLQVSGGVIDTVIQSAPGSYSPGVNVPFSIASRHGDNFINGAVDGTALTADLTPTILPDLSATSIEIAPTFNGYIDTLRIWDVDIGDTGIEEASA